MKLIGMLDSPYVRRVAISFQLLGLRFEHQPLSVFRNFEQFRAINPVVKVPTLLCGGGEVLMDSNLIIDYGEMLAGRRLLPSDPGSRTGALRIVGLALAACEKSVSVVYERDLRPQDKRHQPWMDRIGSQLLSAYQLLEATLGAKPLASSGATINQAGITVAVAWCFTQRMIPDVVPAVQFPRLSAFSAAAETLPEFRAAPHGESTYIRT